MTKSPQSGATPLAILAIVGFVIAGMTFLVAFITTQRASAPPSYPKLKKIIISPPPRQTIPPLKSATLVEPSPTLQVSPLSSAQSSPTTLPESELLEMTATPTASVSP